MERGLRTGSMRYIKSALVGIGVALLVYAIALPSCIWISTSGRERELASQLDPSQGSFAVVRLRHVNVLPVYCVALAAFGAGFLWSLSRTTRTNG
jgi:hypothetical protein